MKKALILGATTVAIGVIALVGGTALGTEKAVDSAIPQGLTATVDNGQRTIQLDWQDVSGATSYRIYERDSAQGLNSVTASQSRRGPLADNYAYRYWVTATVNGVESAPSAAVDAIVGRPTNPPSSTTTAPPSTTTPSTTTPSTTTPPTTTPPTTTPPGGGVPVGSKVAFVGDYSTGNFAQWSNVQKKGVNSPASGFSGDAGLNLVTPAQGGHPRFANSAKFTVNDGDVPPFGGGERAELRAGNAADVREGDERWYEFSLKFDSTFKNPVGDWFIVAQWHSSSGSPPIAVSVDRDGNLEVSGNRPDNNYSRNIGPVVRGQWVDYVVHVKFSNSASTGFVEVHQNGALAVPKFSTRTMASDSNYFKMGIYRDGDETNKAIVSNAGLRITKP